MKQQIQEQQKENEHNLKILENTKKMLSDKREISEFDFPIDNREEFFKLNLKFIEQQISYAEQLNEEYNTDMLNAELSVYALPIVAEDFELPLTKEEEINLNDRLRLSEDEENYLENENEERYYIKKYGEF